MPSASRGKKCDLRCARKNNCVSSLEDIIVNEHASQMVGGLHSIRSSTLDTTIDSMKMVTISCKDH
jgi:hypothetical protein